MSNYITEVDVLDEAKDNFLTFAEEVLTDRAIPSVEDGLLSVHRKLLWTMEEVLKMGSSSKYKKSASVVGSTLATSYFHGDAACYGAMCKLAQPYLMRYPLVDGEGNFGSQEGNDMQASARYTNARPSIYADLMMQDFKKNIVPLKETYNGEYMEPVMLPGFFPNALVNGREAIGVSMAHNSQPMNLTEVCDGIIAYINNNDITIDGLMEYIKGPDYPLGGTIINAKDIKSAYATGKTTKTFKVRGDYEIQGNKITFTSIPYRTYRNKIREQINKNIDEFDKILSDFTDESNVGLNKLIFTLKDGVNTQKALNKIFSLTDLQTTISLNMNFIVNGTPKLCSLKDLIIYYVNHQTNNLINIALYDKEKAEAKAHVLEGLVLAVDKIDEVISLIKASANKNEAKDKIKAFLSVDDIQATAILDMKLAKLTKLDKEELINELHEQYETIEYCNKIINDKVFRDGKLIIMITNMKNKYGDARRTKLTNIDDIPKEDKEIEYVEPEKCVVVMTEAGTIKRIPITAFKTQKRGGKGVKSQEDIVSAVIRTNTVDSLMIFTDKGQMYRLLVNDIPEGTNASRGVSIHTLTQMDTTEKPVVIYSIYRDTDAKFVLFATKNGLVKKTSLDEYVNTKKKNGIGAIKFKDDDELASVSLIKDEQIMIFTAHGYAIRFNSTEITPTSRMTNGIKGITLSEGDYVVSTLAIRDLSDDVAIFTSNGMGKIVKMKDFALQKRAGKGVVCYKFNTDKDKFIGAQFVNETDTLLLMGDKSSICIKASDISDGSRTSLGIVAYKGGTLKTVSKV